MSPSAANLPPTCASHDTTSAGCNLHSAIKTTSPVPSSQLQSITTSSPPPPPPDCPPSPANPDRCALPMALCHHPLLPTSGSPRRPHTRPDGCERCARTPSNRGPSFLGTLRPSATKKITNIQRARLMPGENESRIDKALLSFGRGKRLDEATSTAMWEELGVVGNKRIIIRCDWPFSPTLGLEP